MDRIGAMLSKPFPREARQNGEGLAISAIKLLVMTLTSKGRIRLDISLESFLREIEARFIVLPISGRACVRALGLPAAYPKDPADRITGAIALAEGLSLLTADRCDPTVAGSSHNLVRTALRIFLLR